MRFSKVGMVTKVAIPTFFFGLFVDANFTSHPVAESLRDSSEPRFKAQRAVAEKLGVEV